MYYIYVLYASACACKFHSFSTDALDMVGHNAVAVPADTHSFKIFIAATRRANIRQTPHAAEIAERTRVFEFDRANLK